MTRSTSSKEPQNLRRATFRDQQRRKQQRTRTYTIVGVTIIALVIAAILIIPNLPVSAENIAVPTPTIHPQANGTFMGDPNAPVKVVEYSDFKCIHCRNFWEDQEQQLIEDYIATGKVYFEYVPLSFVRADSLNATLGAYCALEQDAFWTYHDYLFANYDAEATEPMLIAIAEKAGLDTAAFKRCFNSGDYRQQATDNASEASALGVTGTPTFSVNGALANRAELFTLIDQALSGN